jgi:hypothetical protein
MEEKWNHNHQKHASKTTQLLLTLRPREVLTSQRLRSLGVSQRLANYLIERGVLSSLGRGAYVRGKEIPHFTSALEAIIIQLHLPIHLGGRTALNLLGVSQYLTLTDGQIACIVATQKTKLPHWFCSTQWSVKPTLIQTQFLDSGLGNTIDLLTIDGFKVSVSCRERAILEAIYLIDKIHRFEEIDELFENLHSLSPTLLQTLLEGCSSIRVCRIFLYLAHKYDLPWVHKLDESRIALGQGKREIVKNGMLDPRYLITVPREERESDV